jgi:NADH:ubiquinone oxidoreductase subunit F (NADH-binding)
MPLRNTPAGIIDEMKKSGIRGRGAAVSLPVPSGVLPLLTDQKYVVCNADEGDPAFMDRAILKATH